MAKTALVTGATGLLGRQVYKAFHSAGFHTVGTGHSRASPPAILKVDLTDQDAVRTLFDTVKPSVVCHCAALKYPDQCEARPEEAARINVHAIRYLAEACSSHCSSLIYISTDYVFSGLPGEAPYEQNAIPKPTNQYGQTKLDGENVVQSFRDHEYQLKAAILRVPVLYGPAETPGESAVNVLLSTVLKAQESKANVQMDHWAKRYPTNTEDVARVCVDITHKLFADEAEHTLTGPLQFTSEDCFTKYEMCKIFADIMGLPLGGISANTMGNDPAAKVQRPFDTHLSTRALQDLGIDVSTQDFSAFWRKTLGAYRK